MLEKIEETTEFLKAKGIVNPEAGVILGTGLGGLTSKIENSIGIDYRDIPNFPVSTVRWHAGKLIFGDFGGKKIVAMKVSLLRRVYNRTDRVAHTCYEISGDKAFISFKCCGGVNLCSRLGYYDHHRPYKPDA
jgi:purine nucleoside phosphorylase